MIELPLWMCVPSLGQAVFINSTIVNLMKKLLYFVLLLTIMSSCKKSTEPGIQKALITSPSGPIRYKNEIFTEAQVKVTKDIIYRNLVDYAAGDQKKETLKLNFYEPLNDTLKIRPLIIFVHGGGFVGGSKDDAATDSICKAYIKHGFVVSSLNYRLDPTLNSKKCAGTLTLKDFAQAIYRAVQDANFSVRFLKKVAVTGKIDTNKIFIGGGSAGAIVALHSTYLDDNEVDPALINKAALGKLNYGGFNLSSKTQGAFAYAGAIIDTNWISAGNKPAALMHSTGDNLLPYNSGLDGLFQLLQVYGGNSVSNRLRNLGIRTSFHGYTDPSVLPAVCINEDSTHYWTHGASLMNKTTFNEGIQFVCDFIYNLL